MKTLLRCLTIIAVLGTTIFLLILIAQDIKIINHQIEEIEAFVPNEKKL